MKFSKLILLAITLLLLTEIPSMAQVNITYVVDISLYLDSGNVLDTAGMRIGGRFSSMGINNIPDWTPSSNPCKMTNTGNNRWSITISYPDSAKGKAQDFKFVNGNWGTGKDERSPDLTGCGYISGGNVNRRIIVPNQDSTYLYCWNRCSPCPIQFVVSTGNASAITSNSATVSGFVTGTGIIEQGICFGTNANPTVVNSYTYADPGSGNGNFSANLTMLNPGTVYYFRTYARKSGGYTYGNINTFTTQVPGQFTSITYKVNVGNYLAMGNTIGANGIRIAGNFMNLGAKKGGMSMPNWIPTDSSCAMQNMGGNIWAITIDYPDTASGKVQLYKFVNNNWGPNSNEGSDSLLAAGCGILEATVIHRIFTIPNTAQTLEFCWDRCSSVCGPLPTAPTVSTGGSATAITANSATISGSASGTGISARGVCFGLAPNPSTSDSVVTAAPGSENFTVNLINLQPNTTYYARAFASNPMGTSYGSEISFTTAVAVQFFNITYSVDISLYLAQGNTVGPNGIRIGGNFADQGCTLPNWTPSAPACAMTDNGNNIWSISIQYPDSAAGNIQRYKFVNNDWGTNEGSANLVTGGCGVQDGTDVNRILSIPQSANSFTFCWDYCTSFCEVGNEALKNRRSIEIRPNPFEESIVVSLKKPCKYEITNLMGQKVLIGDLNSGDNSIDTKTIQSGIYLLKMEGAAAIKIHKK
jgi:hypothetical protein